MEGLGKYREKEWEREWEREREREREREEHWKVSINQNDYWFNKMQLLSLKFVMNQEKVYAVWVYMRLGDTNESMNVHMYLYIRICRCN